MIKIAIFKLLLFIYIKLLIIINYYYFYLVIYIKDNITPKIHMSNKCGKAEHFIHVYTCLYMYI